MSTVRNKYELVHKNDQKACFNFMVIDFKIVPWIQVKMFNSKGGSSKQIRQLQMTTEIPLQEQNLYEERT